MIRRLAFAFGAVAIAAMAAAPSRAEEKAATLAAASQSEASSDSQPAAESSPASSTGHASAEAQATSVSSRETKDAAAPKPAAEPASETTQTAESAPPSPAEQPASASARTPMKEEAASKPEEEPSPVEQPAAAPSIALQTAEPPAGPKPAASSAAEEGASAEPEEESSPVEQMTATPGAAPQPVETPVELKAAPQPSLGTLNVPEAAPADAEAFRKALSSLPAGVSDEERNEHAALVLFYEGRGYAALWLTPEDRFNAKASAIEAEIKRSKEWGLDPRDFPLPAGLDANQAPAQSPEERAAAELKISLAILKYGRYARGGRIINPSEELSSYLDRRPQLLKPQAILDGVVAADQADAYLRSLHPQHPQFERLRQKYVALLARNKRESAEAKKLLANMEEWRWMPEDMGDLYVWNNIPDYTQRVMIKGLVARKEAIVTGQTDKQTPIFSRQLRKITFKPTWIVPDSIKVRELLPNLVRGGSLMREWGLEVLRDGQPVNWRKVDWSATDIRNFEVIQPNGPKSVMGKVKFSFPSQHTVFMHDALERDKWMFNVSKRTYSHGCMRVHNPVGLAEILLREDKGWDTAKVRESLNKGGNNNELPIEHKIMVHMTYFTALVDDDGKLHTFPDVYGHERRITLALEGKWNQIVKGRDHLAPVELDEANVSSRHYADDDGYEQPMPRRGSAYGSSSYGNSFLDSLFGGGANAQYPAAPRQYQYH